MASGWALIGRAKLRPLLGPLPGPVLPHAMLRRAALGVTVQRIPVRLRLAAFFLSRVIRHAPGFLLFTIAVCGIAATVACFQFAVFTSFLRAGSAAPRMIAADAWVVARGVECFDFPTSFARDYEGTLRRYMPGATVRRIAFGFVEWRSPKGQRANVAVIGMDGAPVDPAGFAADQSDLRRLQMDAADPGLATIGTETVSAEPPLSTLATFLGAPYVVTRFDTAQRALNMPAERVSYLAINFPAFAAQEHSAMLERMQAEAARAFPEVEIMSAARFEERSSAYWQAKTGAGTAILLAAILAALLMNILLVNAIGRFVQRYDQDLLSLLGHGADRHDLGMILALVVCGIACAALAAALLMGPVATVALRPLLPWVDFRLMDMRWPVAIMIIGLFVAIVLAQRAVQVYGPQAVFRS